MRLRKERKRSYYWCSAEFVKKKYKRISRNGVRGMGMYSAQTVWIMISFHVAQNELNLNGNNIKIDEPKTNSAHRTKMYFMRYMRVIIHSTFSYRLNDCEMCGHQLRSLLIRWRFFYALLLSTFDSHIHAPRPGGLCRTNGRWPDNTATSPTIRWNIIFHTQTIHRWCAIRVI